MKTVATANKMWLSNNVLNPLVLAKQLLSLTQLMIPTVERTIANDNLGNTAKIGNIENIKL